MVFSIGTKSCDQRTDPRAFSSPQKGTPHPVAIPPSPPVPSCPPALGPLSCFLSLWIGLFSPLHINGICVWPFVFDFFASASHFQSFVVPVTRVSTPFFVQPSSNTSHREAHWFSLMPVSPWTFGLPSPRDSCGESYHECSCPDCVWTSVLVDLGAELLDSMVTVESFEELPDGCSELPKHFSFLWANYKDSVSRPSCQQPPRSLYGYSPPCGHEVVSVYLLDFKIMMKVVATTYLGRKTMLMVCELIFIHYIL